MGAQSVEERVVLDLQIHHGSQQGGHVIGAQAPDLLGVFDQGSHQQRVEAEIQLIGIG